MRKLVLLLTLVFVSSSIFSQTPGIHWQLNNLKDSGGLSIVTGDSGIIIALTNIYKFDKTGVLQWKATPAYSSRLVYMSKLKKGSDGNFYVFVTVGEEELKADFDIVKLSPNGNIIWEKTFGGSRGEFLDDVTETSNGNWVIAGSTFSNDGDVIAPGNHPYDSTMIDVWIIEINANGDLLWQRTIGGSSSDGATRIIETSSGNLIASCFSSSSDGDFSHNDLQYQYPWLVNLQPDGSTNWIKRATGFNYVYDIVETSSGYTLLGTNASQVTDVNGATESASKITLGSIDASGAEIWHKDITLTNNDYLNDDARLMPVAGGGFLFIASPEPIDTLNFFNYIKKDVAVCKVDDAGNLVWAKSFSGTGYEDAMLNILPNGNLLVDIQTTSADGDFPDGFNVNSNSENNDIWLVEMDNNGNILWKKVFGGNGDDNLGIFTGMGQTYLLGTTNSFSADLQTYGISIARVGPDNIIKTTVFIDKNTNGVKDAGEPFTTNAVLYARKGSDSTRMQVLSNGVFIADVDTGSYAVSMTSYPNYYTVLQINKSSSFSSYFNTDSLSFVLQPIPNKQDLIVNLIPVTAARPGFISSYRVFYKNEGTTTIASGEILFKKDSRTTLSSSSPAVSSTNGDTLKWTYNNFAPGDTASILVNMQVATPPTVNVGDTLSYMAIITPVATDETPLDDTAILKQRVVGSFDPNDKTENNGGLITSSFITDGSYLQYTVRFQNTGTADAINVIVRDTLGNRVDLSTLEVVTSSHPYALSIENGNQLTWTFNNIMLPASSVNEPASHGYIVYRIKPKSDVVVGETIHNTASIYFDYNLPVLTNDALTLVQDNFSALPVQLISFTGQLTNNTVQLNWRTANETNFEKFEVERSFDGAAFNKIGLVAFVNTNHDYKATDNVGALTSKHIYYRLKLVDADGKFNYSKVIAFNVNEGQNRFTVFPNPANTEMFVSITADRKSNLQIKIVDAAGRTISEEQKTIDKGNNVFPVNTSKLKKGNYLLQIVSGEETKTTKFIIMK